jgi:hypothetical protein
MDSGTGEKIEHPYEIVLAEARVFPWPGDDGDDMFTPCIVPRDIFSDGAGAAPPLTYLTPRRLVRHAHLVPTFSAADEAAGPSCVFAQRRQ